MIKLSIIIPTYNLGKFILKPLESLFSQDLSLVEIIIVNDGSTDDTVNVVMEFFNNKNFNNYQIINQKNNGVSSARNAGINNAIGEYLYFLDGDDFVSSDFIEVLFTEINKNNSEIISFKFDHIEDNGKLIYKFGDLYSTIPFISDGIDVLEKMIVFRNFKIWTASAIYRRDFILKSKLTFTVGCVAGQDVKFIYKALINAKKVVFINKLLAYYVKRIGSITNKFSIRRYDAVIAMYRVNDKLLLKDDHRVENISKYLITNHILGHFLFATDGYYLYAKKPKKKEIYKLIEINYPNLTTEIDELLRNYKPYNFKDKLLKKIFLFSPDLYFKIKFLVKY